VLLVLGLTILCWQPPVVAQPRHAAMPRAYEVLAPVWERLFDLLGLSKGLRPGTSKTGLTIDPTGAPLPPPPLNEGGTNTATEDAAEKG
jgi:hypothetical protein